MNRTGLVIGTAILTVALLASAVPADHSLSEKKYNATDHVVESEDYIGFGYSSANYQFLAKETSWLTGAYDCDQDDRNIGGACFVMNISSDEAFFGNVTVEDAEGNPRPFEWVTWSEEDGFTTYPVRHCESTNIHKFWSTQEVEQLFITIEEYPLPACGGTVLEPTGTITIEYDVMPADEFFES